VSHNAADSNPGHRQPYRVRLPGFVNADDVGLGAAVKRITSSVGIRPCGGCQRRAAALDRRVVIIRSSK
jgi:hypothetical protein